VTFRDPLTSLPASGITSGKFPGDYSLGGSFLLAGTPAGSHVSATPTGLIFYAADGVTPLISMSTAGGAGAVANATVTGGTVTGSTVKTATSGSRVELKPTGLIFYGSDGVTPLISMDTSSGAGTITSALFRTAASGQRLELTGGAGLDTLFGYSGMSGEVSPGYVQMSPSSSQRTHGGGISGRTGAQSQIVAPNIGGGGSIPALTLYSRASGQSSGNDAVLMGDTVQLQRPDPLGAGAAGGPFPVFATDNLEIGAGQISWPGGAPDATGSITYAFQRIRAATYVGLMGALYTNNTVMAGGAKNITNIGFDAQMRMLSGASPAAGQVARFIYVAVWL
jgi:hypothetical protein